MADHTSVGQFIEKRFGITIPAISAWHRAVSSDLTSAFDFISPNDPKFPAMPETSRYREMDAASQELPKVTAPAEPSRLYQEKGSRPSRALPYRLYCKMNSLISSSQVQLVFDNKGDKGAVYHVYNMKRLDLIPRRYTVEADKSLTDEWAVSETEGAYELEVYGPNGYFHKFAGNVREAEPLVQLQYDHANGAISILLNNPAAIPLNVVVEDNVYDYPKMEQISLRPDKQLNIPIDLEKSHHWYDFTVTTKKGFSHRFAGRVETGRQGISDPAMGL